MTAYYWVIFVVDTASGKAVTHDGVFYTLEDAMNVGEELPLYERVCSRLCRRIIREMRFPVTTRPQKDVSDVIRTNIHGAYVASYIPRSTHAWHPLALRA